MPEINTLIPRAQLKGMSRRDRKKQQTRWRIYEAAIELISKHGYDQVKIEDICALADVPNAAFFHHFSTKAAVLGVFIAELKAEIKNKLDEATEADSKEKLQIISREIALSSKRSASFSSNLIAAYTTGDGKLDLEHPRTGITGMMSQIIREGQENGEFSKQWHAELIAESLIASWLIMPLATKDPNFPPDPHTEYLNLILNGLKVM